MGIQTFVFFDLETTGLIQEKIMPRITEIALIAVARESICNGNKKSLPRILHKLVLPINPQTVIPAKVEYLTKLSNEDVQLLQPFKCEVYELIRRFLQLLTPPICFVAHNGNRFDYPIFLWELERINKVLDHEILCIDTWNMFQDFFKRKKDSDEHIIASRPLNPEQIQDLLNDEYNESLSQVLDLVMMEEKSKQIEVDDTEMCTSSASVCAIDKSLLEHDKYIKVLCNEHGEDYSNIGNQSLRAHTRQKANEKTPEHQIIKLQNINAKQPFKKRINSRKRLNFGDKMPINFKLTTIYEYMFNSSFTHEHSAEGDCLAMIHCVKQIADFFVQWSDNHACPLILCKKT